MRIGILGGGATGLLLASYLTNKTNVTLYVRTQEQKNKLDEHGIHLYVNHSYRRSQYIQVLLSENITRSTDDLLIVCVSQVHIRTIIYLLNERGITKPILFLQNGMGHIENIRQLQSPVIVGVIEHGVSRLSNFEVNHLGMGTIRLAPLTMSTTMTKQITGMLHMDSFPVEFAASWRPLLEEKLLVNAVINPLTALFDVDNGVIITNESLRHLAKKLCDETANLLQISPVEAWHQVKKIAQNTARNSSSMRSAIKKGEKTELDAITGYLLKQTDEDSSPFTSFIYHSIVALEQKGVHK